MMIIINTKKKEKQKKKEPRHTHRFFCLNIKKETKTRVYDNKTTVGKEKGNDQRHRAQ